MSGTNIWGEIQKLSGTTVRTLNRRKPFDIISVTEQSIIILPRATGKERTIQRIVVENAYRRLVVTGSLTRSDIQKDFSEYNPAYVVAILAELPGVRYSRSPIRLWSEERLG